MTAGTYDVEVEVGATFKMDVKWKDPNGNPIDNSGYAAHMQMRKNYGDPTVIMEFSTANTAIVLDGASGMIHIDGLAALTEAITQRYGVYDLKMFAPNGDVYRILKGTVDFDPEATIT